MAQHDDASDERSENLAAWQNGPKEDFTIAAAELYSPGSDEVLIKNYRIALNHVDRNVAIFAVFPLPYPAIIGACLAGTVEKVGSDVHDLSVGDRVAAYTAFYARKDHKDNRFGAFQHFSLSKAATVVKIYDYDFTSAASIIASAPLAAVALSHFLKLSLVNSVDGSFEEPQKILCYGASSAIGLSIVQLASDAGHRVICTASSSNHKYLQCLGAHRVFDRLSPQLVSDLVNEGPYKAVVDCVSTQETVSLLNRVLQHPTHNEAQTTIFTLLPIKTLVDDSGEDLFAKNTTKFMWLTSIFASEEHDEFKTWLFRKFLQPKFSRQSIKSANPVLVQGGLVSLRQGLDLVPHCSAQKVVLTLEEQSLE